MKTAKIVHQWKAQQDGNIRNFKYNNDDNCYNNSRLLCLGQAWLGSSDWYCTIRKKKKRRTTVNTTIIKLNFFFLAKQQFCSSIKTYITGGNKNSGSKWRAASAGCSDGRSKVKWTINQWQWPGQWPPTAAVAVDAATLWDSNEQLWWHNSSDSRAWARAKATAIVQSTATANRKIVKAIINQ